MILNKEILDKNTTVYFMNENNITEAWIVGADINFHYDYTTIKYLVQIRGTAAKDQVWKENHKIFINKEDLIKSLLK
jgi:hypothetical protein